MSDEDSSMVKQLDLVYNADCGLDSAGSG